MQNNDLVLETVKKYLVENGADVGDSFVNHAPNNAFIRFSFGNREYVIGMTNTARQILQHWKLEEIDDLLHSYRG